MPDLNRVYLMGNLTRDPEVRYAPSGDAVGDLHLATSRKYKGRDGEQHEDTCFVGVVVWGRQAETCSQYLHKGSLIMIEGSLQFEQWERDGQKQNRLRVRASRVQFLDSRGQGGGQRSESPADTAPIAPEQDNPPRDAARPAPAPVPDRQDTPMDEDNLPF